MNNLYNDKLDAVNCNIVSFKLTDDMRKDLVKCWKNTFGIKNVIEANFTVNDGTIKYLDLPDTKNSKDNKIQGKFITWSDTDEEKCVLELVKGTIRRVSEVAGINLRLEYNLSDDGHFEGCIIYEEE